MIEPHVEFEQPCGVRLASSETETVSLRCAAGVAMPGSYDVLPDYEARHAALERYRTLAEVGSFLQPGGAIGHDGVIFCKKVPAHYRHPDLLSDGHRNITLRISAFSSAKEAQSQCSNTASTLSPIAGISDGTVGPLPQMQALRIDIYEDNDPYTLLELVILKDDFIQLRKEQRLLVDFLTFPGMLIRLLDQCGACLPPSRLAQTEAASFPSGHTKREDPAVMPSGATQKDRLSDSAPREHRFGAPGSSITQTRSGGPSTEGSRLAETCLTAVLICEAVPPTDMESEAFTSRCRERTGGGQQTRGTQRPVASALLNIVETNAFKELTHLVLRFTAASFDCARRHLGQRLGHVQSYAKQLETEVVWFRHQTSAAHAEIRNLHTQNRTLHDSMSTIREEMKRAFDAQVTELESQHAADMDRQRQAALDDMKSADNNRARLEQRVAELEQTLKTVSASEKTLLQERSTLTDTLLLKSQKADAEAETRARYAEENRQLEGECRSLRARIAADQEELVALKEKLTRADVLATPIEVLKKRESELCSALEKSAQEISKGNEWIQKLQHALKRERSRVKQLRVAGSSISELQTENEKDRHKLRSDMHILELDKQRLEEEVASLTQSCQSLKEELKKAQESLTAQELKINTLEKQLTARTVQAVLSGYSSSSLHKSYQLPSPSHNLLSQSLRLPSCPLPFLPSLKSGSSRTFPDFQSLTPAALPCPSPSQSPKTRLTESLRFPSRAPKFSATPSGASCRPQQSRRDRGLSSISKTTSVGVPTAPKPTRLSAPPTLTVLPNLAAATSTSPPQPSDEPVSFRPTHVPNGSNMASNDNETESLPVPAPIPAPTPFTTLSISSTKFKLTELPSRLRCRPTLLTAGSSNLQPESPCILSKDPFSAAPSPPPQTSQVTAPVLEPEDTSGFSFARNRSASSSTALGAFSPPQRINSLSSDINDHGEKESDISSTCSSLNYSISTLESSGAPHFGYSKTRMT